MRLSHWKKTRRTTQPLSTLRDEPAGNDFPCPHRGKVIEQLDCLPCQTSFGVDRVDVFACGHPSRTHHPKCTIHNVLARGDDGLRPAACATCPLREE